MKSTALQSQPALRPNFAAPSGRGFIALLGAFRATGGTAPGAIVSRLLGERPVGPGVGPAVSLADLIDTGQAFGFGWRNTLWLPMFQFDAHTLALQAGAQSVRAELPSRWSGWQVASWFAAPNARLDGRRPADSCALELEAVLRAARLTETAPERPIAVARRAHELAEHA